MPRAARGRSSGGGSSAPSLWGGGNSTPPPVAPPPVVDNIPSGVSTGYRATSQRQAGVETGLALDQPYANASADAAAEALSARNAAMATGAFLDQPPPDSRASIRAYNATAASAAAKVAKDAAGRPGVTTVDVTSPAGLGASLGKSLQQQGDMLSGLNTTLFGGATSLPFVGPIIKGITGVPGTVVDTAANVANLLGSGAARLPSGTMLGPFVGLSQGGAGMTEVATRFNAAPDSPEKQQVIAAMAKDPATAGHLATEFLKALAQEQQAVNPQLFPEYSVPSGSFLDDLGTAFSLPGVTSRLAERTVAGIPKLTGKDRIDEIIAVEEGGSYTGVLGTGAFAGKEKNTPIETLAAQNVINEVWTRAQALDFLSASGAGVSHDQALEIAGQIALDPQVWGSLGASAASKLGTVTMRLLRGGEGVVLRAATPETLLVRGAAEVGVPLEKSAAQTFFEGAARVAREEGFQPARRSSTWVADMSDAAIEKAKSFVPGLSTALSTSDARVILARAAEGGVPTARLNVLGHLAASDRVPPIMRAIGGTVYDPITQAGLGRAAKVVRTIIDPLHAIGGNHVIGESMVGLTSEAATRVMVNAHGPTAMANVARIVSGVSADLGEKLFQDVGTYSANASRLVLLRTHVNNVLNFKLAHILPRTAEEARLLVSDLVENAPKNWPDLLKQHFVNVREMLWDDAARANLAERMAAQYGHADEWPSILAKFNQDELSILHAATYGRATAGILDALRAGAVEVGQAAAKKLKLDRVILLNRRTLTDLGAKGILDSITPEGLALAAKDAKFTRVVHNAVTGIDTVVGDEAAYVQSLLKADGTPFTSVQEYVRTAIADAQRTYPELNYVKIDPQNLGPTMEHFTNNLRFQVENGHLPHQFTDIEVAQMPRAVRDFNDRNAGAFTLGLTPSEDHLMGLVPDGDAIGGYVLGRDPWPDHVAVSNPGYRGTYAMRANAAGMPIPGAVGRTLDHIEAASQALTARVSSAVINLDATKRFVTNVMLKHPDVSQAEASGMIRAIQDAAQVHKTTVRGLEASNIWKSIQSVIPDRLSAAGFGQRELLNLVLDAYEGDLRFVGLTQKFTGRAKALFGRSGSNFAGHISEDLYTRIRFRYNPLFQTQETIEPWALGAQRGINPAFGRTLTPEDRIAQTANRNLRNTSVSRASDMPDQAEQAALAMHGQDMDKMLRTSASPGFWARVTDVQAGKRINEIRALRTNWGATARASFEATHPGTWDTMKVVAEQNAGHLLSDDEYFIRYLGEQSMAGDVKVSAFVQPGEGAAAFARATRTGVYHSPTSIGEVQGLELPRLVERLGFTLKDGTEIRTVDDLRAALAAKTIDNDRIAAKMNNFNMHPDYIRRVTNALDFHWEKFWQDARESYNLTAAETRSLKDMIAGSARVRGMTPVDYASQLWAPTILRGQKASVEALAGAVSILRAPKEGATIDTLVNQMVDVFRHHLDPSGEATLRAAFDAERGIVPAAARADRLSGIGEEARAAFEATGGRPAPAFRPGQGSAEQFTIGEEARQAYEARGGAAGVERRAAAAERRVAEQAVETERRVAPRRDAWTPAHTEALAAEITGATSGVDRVSLPEPFAALDLHVTDPRNLAQIKKVGLQPDANGRVYYWPEGGVDAAAMSEVMGTKGVRKPPLVIGIRDGILQYNEDPAVFSGEAAFHKGAVSPSDLFIQQPDGSWKPLVAPKPVNPDVVRTGTAQFSKWAKAALKDGLLKDDPQYSDLLTKLTGIPTEGAVPYNQMHQLLVNQLGNGMAMGSEDAFRLTYFAKNRTMLERSLNHPFFGLYPASYMYGKILPELVRFMAQTPFGVRTGAAAYIGNDVAHAIALQREFDPDFDKMMNDLGHSEIGWILGYMLPALPQDIGAAWPSWARDLAQQGLDNQARAQRGEPQKPIDLLSPFKKLGDYLNPLRPGMQLERPLGEIGDIAFGSAEERKARSPEGIAAAEKKAKAATDKAARDAADLQAARDKRDAGIAANQARLLREKKARDKKLAVVGPQQGPPAPASPIDIAPVDRVSNMLQSQPLTVPTPVTPQAGLGGVGVNAMDDLRRVLAGL